MRPLYPLLTSIVVAASLFASPARADCASQCAQAWGGYGTYNYNTCYHLQCERPSVVYGAIAYGGQSTANGYAYGKRTQGDAVRTAISNCRKYGNDCRIVATFANECAAVAAVEAEGRFAVGQGGSRPQAEANAMGSCRAGGDGPCQIEVWACAKP